MYQHLITDSFGIAMLDDVSVIIRKVILLNITGRRGLKQPQLTLANLKSYQQPIFQLFHESYSSDF